MGATLSRLCIWRCFESGANAREVLLLFLLEFPSDYRPQEAKEALRQELHRDGQARSVFRRLHVAGKCDVHPLCGAVDLPAAWSVDERVCALHRRTALPLAAEPGPLDDQPAAQRLHRNHMGIPKALVSQVAAVVEDVLHAAADSDGVDQGPHPATFTQFRRQVYTLSL